MAFFPLMLNRWMPIGNHSIIYNTSRLTLLHFSMAGLAILNETPFEDSKHIIDFVYAHQIPPSKGLFFVYFSMHCSGYRIWIFTMWI